MLLLSFADFFQNKLFHNKNQEHYHSVILQSVDQDQDQQSVCPDLARYKLFLKVISRMKSKERVRHEKNIGMMK